MPNVEIDGTNSTVKTNVLTSQSGTAITVPTGKVLTVTDAAGLTVNGATPAATAAQYAIATQVPPSTSGKVLTSDGTNWTSAVAAGGGKINQVIIASNSTLLDMSTATFTDSGLTASITPSAANSRILIHYEMQGTGSLANNGWGTRIARDIASGGYSTLANSDHGTLYDISIGMTGVNFRLRGAYNFMDTTHNSTGVVSYKIQVAAYGGRRIEFTEAEGGGPPTYIILWEILA